MSQSSSESPHVIIHIVLLFAARFLLSGLFTHAVPKDMPYIGTVAVSYLLHTVGWILPFGMYYLLTVRKGYYCRFERDNSFPIVYAYFSAYFLSMCADMLSDFITEKLGIVHSYPQLPESDAAIVLWLIFTVIAVPFAEEFVFRFIVLKRLSGFGKNISVIFSALLFAVCHSADSAAYAFVFGVAFAYIAEKRGLRFSFVLHALNNLLSCIMLLVSELCGECIYTVISFLTASLVFCTGVVGTVMMIRYFRRCANEQES